MSAVVGRWHGRVLALTGAIGSCAVVVGGGRVGPVEHTVPISHWLGLFHTHAAGSATRHVLPGAVLALGAVLLVVTWLLTLVLARRGLIGPAQIWLLAAAWGLPLAIGPPLLSNDVFSYVAQGVLALRGHSPYASSPAVLEWGPAVQAVDPIWLFQYSPYGPLATGVEYLSVLISGGTPVGAVLVLRAIEMASLVGIGLLLSRLVPAERRPMALLLSVANPLFLLQIVSAAHFEGLMCLLIVAALLASVRGHLYLALGLGCAAGAVKITAMVIVLAIVFATWQTTRRHDVPRTLMRVGALIVATWLLLSLLVPDGWGWLRALGTPGTAWTSAAPSAWVAYLFAPILPSTSVADVSYAGRVAAIGAALVVVCYLLATAWSRPLAETAGLGLLTVGLLGPVFFPWYALWGLCCLIADPRRRWDELVIGLSAVLCTIDLPGQTRATGDVATWTAVACVAAYLWWSRRSTGAAPGASPGRQADVAVTDRPARRLEPRSVPAPGGATG